MGKWLVLPDAIVDKVMERLRERTGSKSFNTLAADIKTFVENDLHDLNSHIEGFFIREVDQPGPDKLRKALNARNDGDIGIDLSNNGRLPDLLCYYAGYNMPYAAAIDVFSINVTDIKKRVENQKEELTVVKNIRESIIEKIIPQNEIILKILEEIREEIRGGRHSGATGIKDLELVSRHLEPIERFTAHEAIRRVLVKHDLEGDLIAVSQQGVFYDASDGIVKAEWFGADAKSGESRIWIVEYIERKRGTILAFAVTDRNVFELPPTIVHRAYLQQLPSIDFLYVNSDFAVQAALDYALKKKIIYQIDGFDFYVLTNLAWRENPYNNFAWNVKIYDAVQAKLVGELFIDSRNGRVTVPYLITSRNNTIHDIVDGIFAEFASPTYNPSYPDPDHKGQIYAEIGYLLYSIITSGMSHDRKKALKEEFKGLNVDDNNFFECLCAARNDAESIFLQEVVSYRKRFKPLPRF